MPRQLKPEVYKLAESRLKDVVGRTLFYEGTKGFLWGKHHIFSNRQTDYACTISLTDQNVRDLVKDLAHTSYLT